MRERHQFRIHQRSFPGARDEQVVASGEAPTKVRMLAELYHYALVYAQDGPIRVEIKKNRNKWKELPVDALLATVKALSQ